MDSFLWDLDFPKGYGHTSIAYLKRCPGYQEAKKGISDAAEFVAWRCVKPKRIQELRSRYPSAVLVPVIDKNALPTAVATYIGLPIYCGIKKTPSLERKKMSAMERLLHKPTFYGDVPSGVSCILVDDVITQGGTISALRNYILEKGGLVVAVVALAYAIGSRNIAPNIDIINKITCKFESEKLELFLRTMGIADDVSQLTNSQIRYLLRFRSIERILLRAGILIKR